MAGLADDNVIEHRDAEQLTRLREAPRQVQIGAARRRIARRMVVAQDDSLRPGQNGRPKDFPRAGLRAVERPHAGDVRANHVVLGIYEQNSERFAIIVPDHLTQDRDSITGPADRAYLRPHRALADERDTDNGDPIHGSTFWRRRPTEIVAPTKVLGRDDAERNERGNLKPHDRPRAFGAERRPGETGGIATNYRARGPPLRADDCRCAPKNRDLRTVPHETDGAVEAGIDRGGNHQNIDAGAARLRPYQDRA